MSDQKTKILLGLAEQQTHIKAAMRYYQYIQEDYKKLRDVRVLEVEKAQALLDELDEKI